MGINFLAIDFSKALWVPSFFHDWGKPSHYYTSYVV